MDTLDFLNSLTNGTEAAEGPSFQPHPLGNYHGIVENITQKNVNGRPVWEVFITTSNNEGQAVGRTSFNIWGFSQQDVAEAQRSQDARDRMIESVKRTKRVFTDLKVYTPDQVKTLKWSTNSSTELDILGSFQKLIGCRCSVSIRPNTKDSSKQVTFLNAPVDHVHNDANTLNPPVGRSAPRGAPQQELRPPGYDDSNGIPF